MMAWRINCSSIHEVWVELKFQIQSIYRTQKSCVSYAAPDLFNWNLAATKGMLNPTAKKVVSLIPNDNRFFPGHSNGK